MQAAVIRKIVSFLFLILFLSVLSSFLQSQRAGSEILATGGQRLSAKELATAPEKHFLISALDRAFHILQFDFGKTVRGEPVIQLLREAVGKTLVLALLASLTSLIYAAFNYFIFYKIRKWGEIIDSLNTVLVTTPVFITGIFFIWIFSISLQWLPSGGVADSRWFVLPVIVLALKSGPRIYFFIREFLVKEAGKPYVRTLKANGIPDFRILIHQIKNVLLPALSFWLIDATAYFAGAVITEGLFSIPGLGSLAMFAVFQYDMNLLMGILVCVALMTFLTGIAQHLVEEQASKYNL